MSYYNIEEEIENAFINLLELNTDISNNSYPVRHWQDASKKEIYPIILCFCSEASPEDVSIKNMPLHECFVDISCQTYLYDDKDRSELNKIIKYIRNTLFSSDLVSNLNTHSNIHINSADISGSEPYESDSENKNIFTLTLTCRIQL